jgi:hypothetical protein
MIAVLEKDMKNVLFAPSRDYENRPLWRWLNLAVISPDCRVLNRTGWVGTCILTNAGSSPGFPDGGQKSPKFVIFRSWNHQCFSKTFVMLTILLPVQFLAVAM